MRITVFLVKFRWSVFPVTKSLVQLIVWCWIGHMLFPEPLMIVIHFTDENRFALLGPMIKPWIPHTLCNTNSLLCLNVSWWFKLICFVAIFNPSVHSRGKRYLINDFCDHTTGGKAPCLRSQTHLLHEGSVTWKIMTSSPFLSVVG